MTVAPTARSESLVTLDQCRALYGGCDGELVTVVTPAGSVQCDAVP